MPGSHHTLAQRCYEFYFTKTQILTLDCQPFIYDSLTTRTDLSQSASDGLPLVLTHYNLYRVLTKHRM
jgi:hypothetical protein